ncbi:hypothetical protein PHPALM_11873 [Phytophthora palmivora]|uniref:Tc1-like transposase DDE domain-containing protein n=1 Tax=Phytophthora palmivora TaxID=4796 RepID=A0A2P4Y163_9STRA|nr:hypothetical protein PHPALM_11873 [Phytophthora palmivora]
MTPDLVEVLLEKLRGDPDLTLRYLADVLEHETGVKVTPQTVKNHVDGSCFTLKQMDKEPQYMNAISNKHKHREYLVKLQEYQAMGKTIIYMDETNFNLWSTRMRGRSLRGRRAVKKIFAGGGQNMHVTSSHASVSMALYTGEFNLTDMVLVLDNAPCHCRAEQGFEETEFLDATLLRLGPCSPMLNPIENGFSTFKTAVKSFMIVAWRF